MAVRLFVSKMDGAIFSFLGGFVQRFLKVTAAGGFMDILIHYDCTSTRI
jgi:hypothetical protein